MTLKQRQMCERGIGTCYGSNLSVGCVSSLVCHRSRLRRAEQTEEAAEPEEYPEEETWSA